MRRSRLGGAALAARRRFVDLAVRPCRRQRRGAENPANTGPIAAIAGETPVICSAGVASPCGLDLLGAAGVPVSREIRTYRTTEDFRRLVGDVIHNGERLLCQHVHTEDEVPADACMVAPSLLRYLNNKANVPTIVGPDGAPKRSSITAGDVAGLGVDESWVLKVCSEDSSGGGYGVYVHQAGSAIAQPGFVQPGADLIVEEYLELVENWCVHFCVEAIGPPRLIGATEQLISDTGAYGGSRVGGTVLPPAAADLCQAIVERARKLGFIGYCGVDTCLTSSGEVGRWPNWSSGSRRSIRIGHSSRSPATTRPSPTTAQDPRSCRPC